MALAYGACFRKPVWVWWGGTVHTAVSYGRLRGLLRRLIARWNEHWISYGTTSTEYLLTLGIPRERILQIQNSVDERAYTTKAAPLWQIEPKPVLLYVGRLVACKGIGEFLCAAARLQALGLKFSILLVGDGRDRGALRQLAADLRLQNVCFYPAQPPEAMPGVYRSADVLVFPTMDDVWGLVANEAVLVAPAGALLEIRRLRPGIVRA